MEKVKLNIAPSTVQLKVFIFICETLLCSLINKRKERVDKICREVLNHRKITLSISCIEMIKEDSTNSSHLIITVLINKVCITLYFKLFIISIRSTSIGPSFDNRVKPDVMAQGFPTTLIDGSGSFNADFGTSFAAPLIAGLVACLVEAYPSKHSEEIANYIRESAHLYTTPNDSMGYGIPDFQLALSLYAPEYLVQETEYMLYPNPVKDHIIIDAKTQKNWKAELRIFDLSGKCILHKDIQTYDAYRINLNLQPGSYLIQLAGDINGVYKFQSL